MDTYSVPSTGRTSFPSVWYAFSVANARFYIHTAAYAGSNAGSGTLHSDDYRAHWTVTAPEYLWLANDLATHPAQLKFVVLHFPLYSDNATEKTDTFLHGPHSLAALLTQHGVQFVFNGHTHIRSLMSSRGGPARLRATPGRWRARRSRSFHQKERAMNGKVLVAYATRYGSTAEVAEAIGARLQERGLAIEVTPVQELRSVEDYDAVVLGTPFYMGSMLKEARAFLERRREELGRLPVALFALGPTSADDDLEEAGNQLDKALEKLPWMHPTAAEMFVGKFDPAKLRFANKLVTALPASPLHGLAAHDDRDWAAIKAWADGVAASLPRAATGASEVEARR